MPHGPGLIAFIAAMPLLVTGLVLLARQPTVSSVLAAEAGHARSAAPADLVTAQPGSGDAPDGAAPDAGRPVAAGGVTSASDPPGAGPR